MLSLTIVHNNNTANTQLPTIQLKPSPPLPTLISSPKACSALLPLLTHSPAALLSSSVQLMPVEDLIVLSQEAFATPVTPDGNASTEMF